MADEQKGTLAWLASRTTLPRWLVIAMCSVGTFNCFIFVVLLVAMWQPRVVPVPITGDVAIGLHISLLQTFLAVLSIGLAALSVVGYAAVRDAAVRQAKDSLNEWLKRQEEAKPVSQPVVSPNPDLSGLPSDGNTGKRQELKEEGDL